MKSVLLGILGIVLCATIFCVCMSWLFHKIDQRIDQTCEMRMLILHGAEHKTIGANCYIKDKDGNWL